MCVFGEIRDRNVRRPVRIGSVAVHAAPLPGPSGNEGHRGRQVPFRGGLTPSKGVRVPAARRSTSSRPGRKRPPVLALAVVEQLVDEASGPRAAVVHEHVLELHQAARGGSAPASSLQPVCSRTSRRAEAEVRALAAALARTRSAPSHRAAAGAGASAAAARRASGRAPRARGGSRPRCPRRVDLDVLDALAVVRDRLHSAAGAGAAARSCG